MSAIKIPSSKIYQIDNQKVINNIVDKLKVNYSTINLPYGNIIEDTVYFNFYGYDYENKTIITKYQDIDNTNGYTFELTRITENNIQFGYLTATIKLKVNKNCKIVVNSSNEIQNFKLQSKKSILQMHIITSESGTDLYEIASQYEKNNLYVPKIDNYDEDNRIITLTYKVQAAAGGGGNALYVISDEISLIGNYVETDENNFLNIGDGKHLQEFSGNELVQTTNYISNLPKPIVVKKISPVLPIWEVQNGFHLQKGDIIEYNNNEYKVNQISEDGIFTTTPELAKNLPIGSVIELIGKQINANNYNYNQVIDNWKNGKEVATIRCAIDNYYDTDGELKISKNGTENGNELPMTFHIGDIVVPYVYGANGKDKPMSLNKDGTPKQFNVLGKKMIYDGGVWQTITLQEI